MAEYKHGAYAALDASVVQQTVTSETVPVYFGTAPVGLVRGYADLDVVNAPVKISSLADARAKIGYSPDFGSYTLCEAVAAHFDADTDGVGPIYVVNVLDPAVHKKSAETTKEVSFTAGRCEVATDTAVLDTVAVKDSAGSATYVEGTDYTLDYNANSNTIVITAVEEGGISDGAAKVTYTEMDPSAVDADDVVGMVTSDGQYSGIEALALLYQEQFVVPNLLAAPGWSHEKKVYDALVDHSTAINGHWDAFVAADLPLVDDESQMVDTIAKALAWKDENNYTSERSAVCWPMAEDADGRRFHVSTLFAVESQRVDQTHGGVPMESPSNKPTCAVRQFFGDNSKNRGFDQQTANQLNASGVTTVIGWAGEWVLWGPHTAAYESGDPSVDQRSYFATNMRLLFHVMNSFQQEWSPLIDQPMTRALRDRIINREQEKLDQLVTQGALIGSPRIEWVEELNPLTNLMEGDFVWTAGVTPVPPAKSLELRVHYSSDGFSVYSEGGAA